MTSHPDDVSSWTCSTSTDLFGTLDRQYETLDLKLDAGIDFDQLFQRKTPFPNFIAKLHTPQLSEDPVQIDEVFDKEANWVAYRCNLHNCGPTCVKYSINKREGTGNGALCRFKAPWKLYEKTEFTKDGLFHVARNHNRVNRYNKALSVGLRHNTDVSFLPTNSSGLAMIFYSTNYSTKLEAPLWKRAALMGAVFDGITNHDREACRERSW